jgi:hypothetical protein
MLRHTIALAAALLAPVAAFAAEGRVRYDALAAASDRVVLGTVGVKSSHWGDDAHIYTDVLVYPDLSIKGPDDGPIVVTVLGGTVGDTVMSVSDGPEFPDAQRVVVFLKREAGRFVVAGRAAGVVSAASAEAADAVEGAFSAVEPAPDPRSRNRRVIAATILARAASASAVASRAQVGCYNTDGGKWNASSATYRIGTTIPEGWAPVIDAAASVWNAAGASFRLVNDDSSVNELSYKDLVAAYGSSYSSTYAVTTTWSSRSTGRISRATIEVNDKWAWSLTGAANSPDVQGILTHEFGHWMRLLDIYSPSTCSDVTMWGSATFGETKKRTLEQADVDGFLSLYDGTAPTPAPAAPVLLSPANGATGVPAAQALAWNAAANATSYDVYLGTSTSPPLVATVSGTTYQPAAALTAGATYYWRVVARNSTGSATSATYSFTIGDAAPSGPTADSSLTLLSPADGATGVSRNPTLQWTPVQGAISYDIHVGTTATPGRIGSVAGTSARVTGFRSGVLYYWRIVARTATGTVTSAAASFTPR